MRYNFCFEKILKSIEDIVNPKEIQNDLSNRIKREEEYLNAIKKNPEKYFNVYVMEIDNKRKNPTSAPWDEKKQIEELNKMAQKRISRDQQEKIEPLKRKLHNIPYTIEMLVDGAVRVYAYDLIKQQQSPRLVQWFNKKFFPVADSRLVHVARWWSKMRNSNIPEIGTFYTEYFGKIDDQVSQRKSTFEMSLHKWLKPHFTEQQINGIIVDVRKKLQ